MVFLPLLEDIYEPSVLIIEINKVDHVPLDCIFNYFNLIELENAISDAGHNVGVVCHRYFAPFILFVDIVDDHVLLVEFLLHHNNLEFEPN